MSAPFYMTVVNQRKKFASILTGTTSTEMKNLFTRRELNLELRLRLFNCYVFSIFLYDCKSWTVDPAFDKGIEAFELYVSGRILRISWRQKTPNREVLSRIGKEPTLLSSVNA